MWKTSLAITLFSIVLGGVGYSLYHATHSKRFVVRVVEIANASKTVEGALPVDPQLIQRLADVPIGQVSLFGLNLEEIEKRVLRHSWIRKVRLEKKFPQTLSVLVTPRTPRALLRTKKELLYVDSDGTAFGPMSEEVQNDLPILSGIPRYNKIKLLEAIEILGRWEKKKRLPRTLISSLTWDLERGYRFMVVYPLLGLRKLARTVVDFGSAQTQELMTQKLSRLIRVLRYLRAKSVATRRILVGDDKKIVVKTAAGS